ncbi:MAG: T9SS type A sorting domain-containing protein [Bacteroidales bacterium]
MRHFYQFAFVIAFLFGSVQSFSSTLMVDDSVTMGGGYANDIYYSFENGEVHSVERTNWEIGFYASAWSAGIITNGGKGVELKLYPSSDTSAWETIDTTGFSGWPFLYNSTEDWEEGAFNRHSNGHPDYGWGVYNTITHDVVGDSLYIVKYMVGTENIYKKLWITKKVSIQNTYYFKYANLDGSDEVIEILNCGDYTDKNFVYYSMQNQEVLDREPNSDTWDILFTKYMGINNGVPYPVTGALNNIDIPANRFDEVEPNFEDWMAAPMDSTKSPIGYDWKTFNMTTFSYDVHDSVAFFVMNFQKDVYKLVFNVFDYTVGKIVFSKSMVHASDIGEEIAEKSFQLFPNPASDKVQVSLEGDDWKELIIADLSGREVVRMPLGNQSAVSVPLGQLHSGVYLVTLQSGVSKAIQKLIIQ